MSCHAELQIQKLCRSLILELANGRVLPLQIPRQTNVDEVTSEAELMIGSNTKTLSLLNPETSESYAKILAVIALFAELIASL